MTEPAAVAADAPAQLYLRAADQASDAYQADVARLTEIAARRWRRRLRDAAQRYRAASREEDRWPR